MSHDAHNDSPVAQHALASWEAELKHRQVAGMAVHQNTQQAVDHYMVAHKYPELVPSAKDIRRLLFQYTIVSLGEA